MNDLISRQAVKELAHNQVREKYCGVALKEHRDFYIKLADSIIDLLPSAQPEPKWIPVSERMPEPRIDVWCNSDMGQMVGYYDEYAETWYGRDYLELIVTAWMPLPEPYKAQESEGDA